LEEEGSLKSEGIDVMWSADEGKTWVNGRRKRGTPWLGICPKGDNSNDDDDDDDNNNNNNNNNN
jgi:hypothetical protein